MSLCCWKLLVAAWCQLCSCHLLFQSTHSYKSCIFCSIRHVRDVIIMTPNIPWWLITMEPQFQDRGSKWPVMTRLWPPPATTGHMQGRSCSCSLLTNFPNKNITNKWKLFYVGQNFFSAPVISVNRYIHDSSTSAHCTDMAYKNCLLYFKEQQVKH